MSVVADESWGEEGGDGEGDGEGGRRVGSGWR